jgi:hypothetical protein
MGDPTMSEGFEEIGTMIVAMASDTVSGIIAFTPRLIGALAVLLFGWLLARLVQAVVERSIRVGLDSILERTGIAQALERTSMTATPSAIVGRVLFWLILIVFIMGASQIVGLDAVSDAIRRVLAYIPNVIAAALVLAAGIFLARLADNLVTSGAAAAGVSYAKSLGSVARGSIIVMVGVVTVEQLGVDTQILITVITVSVAAMAAGLALSFALGSTGVIRGILAGHYLRQILAEGRSVEVAGLRGVVEEVGAVATRFRDGERSWTLPNARLVEELIESPPSGPTRAVDPESL